MMGRAGLTAGIFAASRTVCRACSQDVVKMGRWAAAGCTWLQWNLGPGREKPASSPELFQNLELWVVEQTHVQAEMVIGMIGFGIQIPWYTTIFHEFSIISPWKFGNSKPNPTEPSSARLPGADFDSIFLCPESTEAQFVFNLFDGWNMVNRRLPIY